MLSKELKKAIHHINENGILLVFPVHNKKEPHSLWSCFHPRTPMRWEWDETGDNRVGHMWQLMKRLSDCKEVVYSKWYQGRATFFSQKVFTAMLSIQFHHLAKLQKCDPKSDFLNLGVQLTTTAQNILETLESDSPLSTRELKKLCDLQGKDNEANYSRSMKALFTRLLIVAFGEVEDGAFPSLAVGATRLIYEDLCSEARGLDSQKARAILEEVLLRNKKAGRGRSFLKFFDKNLVGDVVTN